MSPVLPILRTVFAVALTAILACPQSLIDEPLRATGHVVDSAGAPVANAVVRLVKPGSRHRRNGSTLRWAMVLAPLSTTRTAKDGGYELRIEAPHVIAGSTWSDYAIEVRKPGYRTWLEHIPSPIARYTGSNVVLPKAGPHDTSRIRVPDAPPGVRILVRPYRPHWDVMVFAGPHPRMRVFDLAADGTLTIDTPEIPNPPITTDPFATIRWNAWVLSPGRSQGPFALKPGSETVLALGPKASELTTEGLEVTSKQELRSLRGLFRLLDGSCHWFPLPENWLPEDQHLEAIAVTADGHATQLVSTPLQLTPLPPKSPGHVAFVDSTGRPIEDCQVTWLPMTSWPRDGDPHYLARDAKGVRKGLVGPRGRAPIPSRRGYPWFLSIEAQGYRTRLVVDPRPHMSPITLDSMQSSSVEVHLVNSDEDPAHGVPVLLWMSVPGGENSLFAGEPVITNADGVARFDSAPATGSVYPEVIDHRFTLERRGSGEQVANGETVVIRDRVIKQNEYRCRIVDKDGEPVPFGMLEYWRKTRRGSQGTVFYGDSKGMTGISTEPGARMQVRDSSAGLLRGRLVDLSLDRVNQIEAAPYRPLFVRTPIDVQLTDHQEYAGSRWKRASRPTQRSGHGILRRAGVLTSVFGVEDGPPIICRMPTPMPPGGTFDPIILDRRAIVHRVPLTVTVNDGAALSGLVAIPTACDGMRFFRPLGSNMAAQEDGKWFLVSRDKLDYECIIAHPGHLPVTVKLLGNDVTPITAKLLPGKPLSLAMPLPDTMPHDHALTVRVTEKTRGFLGFGVSHKQVFSMQTSASRNAAGKFEFVFPHAFPTEKSYRVEVSSSFGRSQRAVEAKGLEALVIDLPAMTH